MEVRNLITFLKIIETGSFSKAAEQLTYSQSTVTVQIQQLEEEIGVQLFDRIGKKIYVTEKGHELEAYAQQIIALTQQAAAIGGEEQELQGTLRLACLDSPGFIFSLEHFIRSRDHVLVRVLSVLAEPLNVKESHVKLQSLVRLESQSGRKP